MGTNFYWLADTKSTVTLPTDKEIEISLDRDDPDWHIGKRSAAGLYCWDCNKTLCLGGERAIHMSTHDMADKCPKCGGKQGDDPGGPAMVELGFADARAERPVGVRGCASFTWAQDPDTVRRACEKNMDTQIIESEYGDKMTGREFLVMLVSNCPVEFMDMIGRAFS